MTPGTVIITNEAHFTARSIGPNGRDRLVLARRALEAPPALPVTWLDARPASRAELERVHTPAYLDQLERFRGAAPAVYEVRRVLPGSMAAILLAAGAAAQAVDLLLEGSARNVFCLVEPPGHHAEPGRSMGFCAVDNVAVAAAHALARGGRRVMVVDWDVHHGNGTQHAFEAHPGVLFVDLHQEGIFPGSGRLEEAGTGEGIGTTLNVPLPEGAGDADLAEAFRRVIGPAAAAFAPELILVSAGFDAHDHDPLGGLRVSDDGFGYLTRLAVELAEAHAGGRLALVLEGGYDAAAVARCVRRCVEVLAGGPAPAPPGAPSGAMVATLERIRETHPLLAPRG